MNRRELKQRIKLDPRKLQNRKIESKVLDIYLESIDDAYSVFSGPSNHELDGAFKDYLLDQKVYIDEFNIIIKNTPTEAEKEELTRSIDQFIENKIAVLAKMQRFTLVKNLIFILLGALFIFLSYHTSSEKIFTEVYMVIGWFLIWEFANSFFINNPTRTFKKHHLLSIYYAEKNIK